MRHNGEASSYTDETLMRHIDGELLDPQLSLQVALAISRDPELAERAAVFQTTRDASRSAFAAVLSEPPSQHLLDIIARSAAAQGDRPDAPSVAEMQPARHRAARLDTAPSWTMPLAACLVIAAGLGGFVFGKEQQPVLSASGAPLGLDSGIIAALSTQISGEDAPIAGGPRRIRLLGTYTVADGLCRTFAVQDTVPALGSVTGLACRKTDADGWRLEIALRQDAAPGSNIAPASGTAAHAVDDVLEALGAGPALAGDDEAKLLSGS